MASKGSDSIRWHELLLTTDTSAVAAGDVLADTQLVANNFFTPLRQTQIIQSLHVFDGDDQGKILDVLLLNEDVSVGTENAAVSISAANALAIVGNVHVVAADYVDLVNTQLAIPQFNPFVVPSGDTSQSLYVAVVAREAGTYAGSLLRVRIGALS